MYCILCGAENDDSNRFCLTCGAQLQTAEPCTNLPNSTSYNTPNATNNSVQLSVDLEGIAQQIEESRDDYNDLVEQFKELRRRVVNNEISKDVFEVARQQLVMSHAEGQRAAEEAEYQLLSERFRRGEISEAAYLIKRDELKAQLEEEKRASDLRRDQVMRDAKLSDLNDKRNRGEVSDSEYAFQRERIVSGQADQPISQPTANPADSGSMGYGVLGFFFPLVGLILYLVWKDSKPLSASKAGKGALAGVITSVALYLLYFIFIAVMVSSATRYYY